MSDPDLPPDAPLRHRLWFRFWRGWRKAMIGLVVLVAVAWGTRPVEAAHAHALNLMLRIPGEQPWPPPLTSFEDAIIATRGSLRSRQSFGAFGYVWVLD